MSIQVACKCGARFKARDESAGKRGVCPKCGETLTIESATSTKEPWPLTPPASASEPAGVAAPPTKSEDVARSAGWIRAINGKPRYVCIGALLVGIVGGYFLGRWHVKQELRSAMETVATGMKSALAPPAREARGRDEKKKNDSATSLIAVKLDNVEDANFGVRLTFTLTNTAGKPISACKGGIHVYDQFEDHLSGFDLPLDEPLGAGVSISHNGAWHVSGRAEKLLKGDRTDLTFKYRAEQVIYADGTREVFK